MLTSAALPPVMFNCVPHLQSCKQFFYFCSSWSHLLTEVHLQQQLLKITARPRNRYDHRANFKRQISLDQMLRRQRTYFIVYANIRFFGTSNGETKNLPPIFYFCLKNFFCRDFIFFVSTLSFPKRKQFLFQRI